MQARAENYRLKPQLAFRQIYLSHDRRDDVLVDAEDMLAQLRAGEDPEQLGDTLTMLPGQYALISQIDIERRFGNEFARQIVSLPQGVWSGPVPSGFGAHLVLVSERVDGRQPELAEVEEAVKRDWLVERRKALKEATFRELLKGYEVVIEQPGDPDYAASSAVAATLPETGSR